MRKSGITWAKKANAANSLPLKWEDEKRGNPWHVTFESIEVGTSFPGSRHTRHCIQRKHLMRRRPPYPCPVTIGSFWGQTWNTPQSISRKNSTSFQKFGLQRSLLKWMITISSWLCSKATLFGIVTPIQIGFSPLSKGKWASISVTAGPTSRQERCLSSPREQSTNPSRKGNVRSCSLNLPAL